MRQMLRRFQARSVLGLILAGFTLVLIPPVAALWMAGTQVNKLSRQSQVAVVEAVKATQGGRLLASQMTAMERSARQYLVVRDDNLLDVYREAHRGFRDTLEGLKALKMEAGQQRLLERLDRTEEALYQVFGYPRERPESREVQVADFVQAQEWVRDFLAGSNRWVDREVQGLEALAAETTLILNWLMVAVVPLALLLAALFTALIVRPLRRLSLAIRRLGREDFHQPIAVRGPRDIELLGDRLDWLRLRLMELEQQKVRFLRHMSHELKTPLTALREGGELLADQVLGPLDDDQREVAGIMRDNAIRLQRLIEDLLSFNQLINRSTRFVPQAVDLRELVAETVEAQRLAWKARELTLDIKLPPVTLAADREKLKTVLDNLLSNAVKFSPPGSTVHIDAGQQDGELRLRVRDAGPGIHPADRERIFEAFYQGRTTPDSHVKGSGLGLAIAREFAAIHQGRLEVIDNGRPGGCLQLSLPLREVTS